MACQICHKECEGRRCKDHEDTYAPAGPVISAFHADRKFVKGIIGPFGCLAGDSLIVTENGPQEMSSIGQPVRVLSWNDKKQRFQFADATASYLKGEERLYEVTTVGGKFVAAGRHRVLRGDHTYGSVEELAEGDVLFQRHFLHDPTVIGLTVEVLSIVRQEKPQGYWDITVFGTHNYVTVDGTIHHNSSKSVACCFEIFLNAAMQNVQSDGKRRSRYAVVRQTYRELSDSTIKTWMDWMGHFGTLKVTDNAFLIDYGDIEAEILFRALDRPDDVEKLKSVEYTGAWLNEAKEIPYSILNFMTGRVGRYPSIKDGGPIEPRIIFDTNAPDEDEQNWIYKLFEVDYYKDPQIQGEYALYKQPPGAVKVNGVWEDNFGQVPGIPKAENIDNLPERYYSRMCIGKTPEWIKVYVEGKYGFVQDGKPVYTQYNDNLHCVDFAADPTLPLLFGLDAGLTPACLIAQLSPRGQLRIIDELLAKDMGMYQFARDGIKPHLAKKYQGFRMNDVAWADPSKTRGDAAQQSAMGILNDMYISESEASDGVVQLPLNLPFSTVPARTNELVPRLDAVNQYLTRLIDGAPALLIHPRCTALRKGFLGRYRFERVQVSGDERYKEIPKKNHPYSDIHDCLQYICMGTMLDSEEIDDYDYIEPVVGTAFSGR